MTPYWQKARGLRGADLGQEIWVKVGPSVQVPGAYVVGMDGREGWQKPGPAYPTNLQSAPGSDAASVLACACCWELLPEFREEHEVPIVPWSGFEVAQA